MGDNASPSDDMVAQAESLAVTDPRNVHALLHVAGLAWEYRDHARAVIIARRAVELAPQDFRSLRTLSGFLSATGQRTEALEFAWRAVRLAPTESEARLHLGGMLASDRQWHLSIEHLLCHVTGGSATAAGWRLLSTALQETGRTERAIEAIDHAMALAPDQTEYRIHRASLLGSRGRYGDAIDELQRAAKLSPDDARVWRALSGLNEVLHDLPAALHDAERAVSLARDDLSLREHLDHIRVVAGIGSGNSADYKAYWAPSIRRQGPAPCPAVEPSLAEMLRIQSRIVYALMLREMRTRFARSRLGYIWALIEPLSHLATLGSVFSWLNHSPPALGDSLFLFYLTGLLPFLMFGHVSQEVSGAISNAGAMLQLPVVKRLDLIVSRAALQFATEIIVAIIVFGGAALFGEQAWPANPLRTFEAVTCLWLIAVGVGALNITLNDMFSIWETFFQALLRMLYFTSGIYYSPIAMPDTIRDFLSWNPVLQCVEYFRSGFYAQYEPHWLDCSYIIFWVVGSLLIGLATERTMRKYTSVLA